MVTIRPFRALRYNPELISDLGRVLSPPYDVIDADEQERLYQVSPYNIVRLILGKSSPRDTDQDNRYTRARRDFDAWQESRVLSRDPTPALYLIEHTFAEDGHARSRVGFIALLELGDAVERAVYRHEATLAAPKHDRMKLLETVPASLEPVFCVYPDAGGAMQARLRALIAGAAPTAHATMSGETIRVWAMTEPSVIQELGRALARVAVLIADGHHRFEVAYAQRARCGALMSYFVSMAEPSLVVRPIHRLVTLGPKATPEILEPLCRIEPFTDLAAVIRWLEDDQGERGRFGYYDGRALYGLTVRPDRAARWLMAPTVPLPLATLDLSLLHGLVLPELGVDKDDIRYTADATQAVQAVDRLDAESAWLLRGIPLAQVYALASQGLTLPPKSTYFYPKVPSGLTIHPLV